MEKQLREQLLLPCARLNEKIVIDCSFEDEHAREHYLLNLVDQVQYLFAEVDRYHSPAFVYLCNLSSKGRLQAEFDRRAPLENLCLEPTESSYLDLFPREKLIYLSPDSENEMTEFDHDAVYIIGGIIDLSKSVSIEFQRGVYWLFQRGKNLWQLTKRNGKIFDIKDFPLIDTWSKPKGIWLDREMSCRPFFIDLEVEVEKHWHWIKFIIFSWLWNIQDHGSKPSNIFRKRFCFDWISMQWDGCFLWFLLLEIEKWSTVTPKNYKKNHLTMKSMANGHVQIQRN